MPGDVASDVAARLAERPLTGQVAVVTGASRGIGAAMAVALGHMGADVVVAARTTTPRPDVAGTIHTTAADVMATGRRCLAVAADMSVAADIESLIQTTVDTFGRIDILVNNAAAMNARMYDTIWDMTPESWRYQIDVNLTALWLATKVTAPLMRDQGGGLIIYITSAGGRPPDPRVVRPGAHVGAAYVASKVAVNRMTAAIGNELRPDGIAVVAIHPGHVRTETSVRMGKVGGFDLTQGHDVAVPVATLARVVAGDRMEFAGEVLYAPEFVAEHGMVVP
jgi:NAD(P)-dependent dehydrogenase (short-subunit alcohol dehydrogenase family)